MASSAPPPASTHRTHPATGRRRPPAVDPDASARALHDRLGVAVIVSDSFGRPFRQGTTDVAIGVAGLSRRSSTTAASETGPATSSRSTQIAVADEIAGAAELVMGKTDAIPAAIVRGLQLEGDGTARDLVMPPERDLFR